MPAVPAPPTSETPRVAVRQSAFERLREVAPAGVEVVLIDDDLDLETVDFVIPGHSDQATLEALPGLTRVAVVQTISAGTDWVEGRVPPQATLCNARGTRDRPVAEWVIAALLGASSRTLECAPATSWSTLELEDLESWTVLIVGMGSIGRQVAAFLEPFGARVVGVASRARDDLHGIDELPALLPSADAVVVLTPLNDDTRGLIGAAELAAMRDGALLVNAARGPVVDTDALVAEVATGRLRAVLDVTDPEPLPDGHPLWTAPGILSITPHMAGDSPLGQRRAIDLAARQITRWLAGEPLENVVPH
ncbi:MAG TPA: NAD(P)-dependent oxidoreductase [Solirubrobacterales bacterium]|nr:NAD(P)-dependent oxidoreductase [Solirubrobacterales bacterium]